MPDVTLGALQAEAVRFRDDREWKQFHDARSLAITLALEAAEVLEHVQWSHGADLEADLASRREAVGDELSDVLQATLLLAEHLGIDLGDAFRAKMLKNAAKYPVAKARGTSRKYTEL